MILAGNRTNRFAPEDLPLKVAAPYEGAAAVRLSVGDASATIAVVDGFATIPAETMAEFFPDLGRYEMHMQTADVYGRCYAVERVAARYTDRARIVAYGAANNDRFDDVTRYPEQMVAAAIQRAEETIERATARSFTTRRRAVDLWPRRVNELPVEDVTACESGDADLEVVNGRQVLGVTEHIKANVTYGAACDASIEAAATQLAAWFLRPKAQAENARGTSMDGVYISYDLATGAEGSWTGLPTVDAAIEQHRSRRVIVG